MTNNNKRLAEALADTLYKASDSQLSHENVLTLCLPFTQYLSSQNQSYDSVEQFTLYVWEQYTIAMGNE